MNRIPVENDNYLRIVPALLDSEASEERGIAIADLFAMTCPTSPAGVVTCGGRSPTFILRQSSLPAIKRTSRPSCRFADGVISTSAKLNLRSLPDSPQW